MSVLVAKEAPDFLAPAVMPEGVIKEDFKLSDLTLGFEREICGIVFLAVGFHLCVPNGDYCP
jgi:hypothetical protein